MLYIESDSIDHDNLNNNNNHHPTNKKRILVAYSISVANSIPVAYNKKNS